MMMTILILWWYCGTGGTWLFSHYIGDFLVSSILTLWQRYYANHKYYTFDEAECIFKTESSVQIGNGFEFIQQESCG